jgi:eukaryotic-like serine/threonine-protein kinase
VSEPSRAARVHAIVSELLALEADHRPSALERLCGQDRELRERVAAAVAAASAPHALLDVDVADLSVLLADEAMVDGTAGPYRLVSEIGRGGMGVVYLAERADGAFERRVAVKVLGEPFADDATVARFLRERQILASLEHPHIARLHDGGHTGDGRPFLAMEYVDGERIDAHCARLEASVEDRVRLFTTVCDAVDHAHRSLVVHGDLKPAHVLVTADGSVKLLDFGIARLMEEAGPESDDTVKEAHPLTPRYASPEQIRGGRVTTATDVYALGLILYELLAGRPPVPEHDDPLEAVRARLEADPPPPSSVAPVALRRRIRGDLDAIVLRALRRDPAERYPGAAQLGEDLRRWLRHEPVAARPGGAAYRARRFVRRHPAGVAGAAALLVVSVGAGAFHVERVGTERDRAELEARKAAEVRDFLIGLFTSGYPQQSLGDTARVADLLERGVARADSLEAQPELRALLLATLGDVYRELGQYDRAESLVGQALGVYDAMPRAPPLGMAGALWGMALVHFDQQRYVEARDLTRRALAIQRRELGDDHPDVLSSVNNLATSLANTGAVDEALALHEELLERRRRLFGPSDPGVAVTLNNIGTLLYRSGRHAEAEPRLVEALALRRAVLDPGHPDVALSMNNLAGLYRQQGRFAEAEPLLREAVAIRRRVLGDSHPRVAVSEFGLGRLLHMMGEPARAVPHLRAALDIDRRAYGPDHPEVAVDAYQLAVALVDAGECGEGVLLLTEAAGIFERHGLGEDAARARAGMTDCSAEVAPAGR